MDKLAQFRYHQGATGAAAGATVQVKYEDAPSNTERPVAKGKGKKAKKASKTRAKPEGWEAVYAVIEEMRAGRDAPVDTMGCDRLAEPDAPPAVRRFQTLVALMLSSQTKDEVTYAAMRRLQRYGLTPERVAETCEPALQELIKPVGFFRRKAGYLRLAAQELVKNHGSDIPNGVANLVKLKGVGPKMAHICQTAAWDDPQGVGVDVHVHRIVNRLRWFKPPTNTPEETREGLEDWLPKDKWAAINPLLVGFGQTICLPTKPRCWSCRARELCPTGRRAARPTEPAAVSPSRTGKAPAVDYSAVDRALELQARYESGGRAEDAEEEEEEEGEEEEGKEAVAAAGSRRRRQHPKPLKLGGEGDGAGGRTPVTRSASKRRRG